MHVKNDTDDVNRAYVLDTLNHWENSRSQQRLILCRNSQRNLDSSFEPIILIRPQTEHILIAQLQGLYTKSAANEMWGCAV